MNHRIVTNHGTYEVQGTSALITKPRWRCGLLFRWCAAWIGYHWSSAEHRLCLNLIPFVTIWICPPGGRPPKIVNYEPRENE